VADAAHELRTPLTALKGRLDVVRQRERDAAAYRAAIDGIEPEVERLIRLVRDLLLLARLETETAPWDEAPVDVSQLCERIAEQMRPLAAERGLTLALDVAPGLTVSGSFDHLLRALINLLDNAIKYADSPGQVTIGAHWWDGRICLQVSNDGRALDSTVIDRLGDRFLRTQGDRSRETGGVGLGLAITAEIARRHRGSLALAPRPGGGTVATIVLSPEA
jgi:signal transduction histidine kinase